MTQNMTDTKKSRKRWKIALIIAGILLILLLGILAFAGNYFYNFALNPNAEDGFGTAAGIEDNEYTRWLLADSEDVYLDSFDGLKLHAYRVDGAAPHRYAILCHGYQNNATGMSSYARHFFDAGYTVLLPDARGHGESEGDYIGMGWHERRDIVKWAASIVQEDAQAEILLFGLSMGAATVMMTAGEEDLPSNVKCIVEDCGYTSVYDEFAGQLKELYGLPPVPILNAFDVVCRIRAGYSVYEASAVEQVKKSHTPTLFIHGSADTFVPFWMLDEVYDAAACEKEKLVVPGAAHAESAETDPALYWDTVDAFVAGYMS